MSDMTPAAMMDFNQTVIDEFRANGGETSGPFAGAPLLLLNSTGAKSGEPRTSPVVHTPPFIAPTSARSSLGPC